MKMIFVSLHLLHRRMSLVGYTSIFTVLREALLGYRGACRFVFGTDTNTHLWGCSDGRLLEIRFSLRLPVCCRSG